MKTSNTAAKPVAVKKAPVLTLPQWSQAERAAPNVLLRGLFKALAVGNRGSIPAEKPELLLNTPQLRISYTGQILAQPELDVWQVWLDLASRQGSLIINCSNSELLAALGRDDSGAQYEKLKIQITKLVGALPEVTAGSKIEMSNLATASYDRATKLWEIRLNPYIATLFRTYGYTRVSIAERRSLADVPLAQWLHIFFATHELAAPYPLSQLQALSGRPAQNFVRDVKLAIDALKRNLPTTESTGTADKQQAERKGWHIELINAGTARKPDYYLHMNKRGLTAAEVTQENAERSAQKRAAEKQKAAKSKTPLAVVPTTAPTTPASPAPLAAGVAPDETATPAAATNGDADWHDQDLASLVPQNVRKQAYLDWIDTLTDDDMRWLSQTYDLPLDDIISASTDELRNTVILLHYRDYPLSSVQQRMALPSFAGDI